MQPRFQEILLKNGGFYLNLISVAFIEPSVKFINSRKNGDKATHKKVRVIFIPHPQF